MDQNKLTFNFNKLEKRFNAINKLNKTQMLQAINKSYKSCKRAEKENNKYDFPKANQKKSFNRKSSDYNTYEYDLYDIAEFLTDKDYYWQMLKKRQKND